MINHLVPHKISINALGIYIYIILVSLDYAAVDRNEQIVMYNLGKRKNSYFFTIVLLFLKNNKLIHYI